MNCPRCGKEMERGRVATFRGDNELFWAPQAFFDKHWLNKYFHMNRTIEAEGGMIITTNSRAKMNAMSYGCKKCKMIVLDCK